MPNPFPHLTEKSAEYNSAISGLLDGFTQLRLLGLLDLHGTACLEVGAGHGSIATWLADQVGSEGRVVATDIDIRHVPPWPDIAAVEHDITRSPVSHSGKGYDLAHARLLLSYLPRRREALDNMVSSIRPGGVVVTEDFVPVRSLDFVQQAPTVEDARLLQRLQFALGVIAREHNYDRSWPARASAVYRSVGLVDIDIATLDNTTWSGGGYGCQVLTTSLAEHYDELLRNGFDADDLRRVAFLLSSPKVKLAGHRLVSISGRLPT